MTGRYLALLTIIVEISCLILPRVIDEEKSFMILSTGRKTLTNNAQFKLFNETREALAFC